MKKKKERKWPEVLCLVDLGRTTELQISVYFLLHLCSSLKWNMRHVTAIWQGYRGGSLQNATILALQKVEVDANSRRLRGNWTSAQTDQYHCPRWPGHLYAKKQCIEMALMTEASKAWVRGSFPPLPTPHSIMHVSPSHKNRYTKNLDSHSKTLRWLRNFCNELRNLKLTRLFSTVKQKWNFMMKNEIFFKLQFCLLYWLFGLQLWNLSMVLDLFSKQMF